MKPHEERVIEEKKELDEKLVKLYTFMFDSRNPTFNTLHPVDRDLLENQYTVMKQYSDILGKRIDRFTK